MQGWYGGSRMFIAWTGIHFCIQGNSHDLYQRSGVNRPRFFDVKHCLLVLGQLKVAPGTNLGFLKMKRQIRLFTTVMVCMAMALCVSCKKDDDSSDSGGGNGGGGNGGGGSQTVEARLSKIIGVVRTEELADGGQTWTMYKNDSVTIIFTWNNRILSNINIDQYHYNGPGTEVLNDKYNCDFHYDNNRLSYAITECVDHHGLSSTSRVDVTYDGDNISDWTYYEDGEIMDALHFEYSNGKLSSVTDVNNRVHNYFWNGDNLSEIKDDDGDMWLYSAYDDKKNPFYGNAAWQVVYGFSVRESYSKNNPTKVQCWDSDHGFEPDETIDYTYNDKNYPKQSVHTEYYDICRRKVTTYTYEYLD